MDGLADPVTPSRSVLVSIPRSVNVPVEIQASQYFYSNYILNLDGVEEGDWCFLLPLLKQEPDGTQLSMSVVAAALALFSTRPCAKHVVFRARQMYLRAVASVEDAFSNPFTLKSDHTLASVLLLGLYNVRYPSQIIKNDESCKLNHIKDNHIRH